MGKEERRERESSCLALYFLSLYSAGVMMAFIMVLAGKEQSNILLLLVLIWKGIPSNSVQFQF